MIISTRGRYAVRVMIDLAEHQNEGYIPLKDIAKRQDISEKYLEIILKGLVQEKLLKGLRGKGGGYRLTRTPQEYRIIEILELTEGPLTPVACLAKDAEPCRRSGSCPVLPMWREFGSLVHDYFYRITLADLVKDRQTA